MKSRAAPRFWKLYNRLPRMEQQRARKAYQMWKTNPNAPGLHFKRVSEAEPIYSAQRLSGRRVVGRSGESTVRGERSGRSVGGRALAGDDGAITITFMDGSVATIVYTAHGDKAYSRERFELFADQSVAVLADFREVHLVRNGSKKRIRRFNQDICYS